MTISNDVKKLVIVVAVAGLIFWLLKPGYNVKPKENTMSPEEKKRTANQVADAYIAAMMDNKDAAFLEELNRESEKQFGMRAYQKQSDKKIYVKDVNGVDIKLS